MKADMTNNENMTDPDKDKPVIEVKAEVPVTAEVAEQEQAYTENDIVLLDGAEYHTNFTNKYIANRGYQPSLKDSEMRAFLPGQIIKVFVKKRKKFKANNKLISFEAMKMINEITLNDDIKIEEVFVKKGETVEKNQLLFKYNIIPKK
jgi:biotin carboxyl carrier protein